MRDGILDRNGRENIHGNVDHAVKAETVARGDDATLFRLDLFPP
jgi:hypothetical protein